MIMMTGDSMFISDDNDKSLRKTTVEKKSIDEGEIFSLVFGFIPQEYDICTSPFRVDTSAGCEFRYGRNGKLMFFDPGNSRRPYMDCYEAIKIHYNIPDFRDVLTFINSSNLKEIPKSTVTRLLVKRDPPEILFYPRPFQMKDKEYWSQYGITKKQLIEDKVFPIQIFKMKNTRKGDFVLKPKEVGYAYTEFIKGRKKLYLPKDSNKFYTNCKQNDIGGYNKLPKKVDILVIAKSYKDYRVLKNLGYTVIWFMNEGMIPKEFILLHIGNIANFIVIFFDNDRAGIEAAIKLSLTLTKLKIKNKYIHLSEILLTENISDPSDYVASKSEEELKVWTNLNIKL